MLPSLFDLFFGMRYQRCFVQVQRRTRIGVAFREARRSIEEGRISLVGVVQAIVDPSPPLF